jgi:hypothetical protein
MLYKSRYSSSCAPRLLLTEKKFFGRFRKVSLTLKRPSQLTLLSTTLLQTSPFSLGDTPMDFGPSPGAEFLKRINLAASELGIESLKGHGIRIGATLEYLLRGVPFAVMKSIGRWSGNSFLLYLRQHAVVIAPYIQGTPIMDAFTRYTMPPPR